MQQLRVGIGKPKITEWEKMEHLLATRALWNKKSDMYIIKISDPIDDRDMVYDLINEMKHTHLICSLQIKLLASFRTRSCNPSDYILPPSLIE